MQPPPGAPRQAKGGGCLKAFLIVAAVCAVLGIGIVVLIPAGLNKASDEIEKATEAEVSPVDNEPDAQPEDQQAPLGGEVRLSGYTVTVHSATFQPQLSEFEDEGYLVAQVTVLNRDDRAQSYNTFDWKLQTPNGQVIDPSFTGTEQLGSGDLVPNGTVSGRIIWEVGDSKGDFFVIYKPDLFDAARGIWKVSL